MVSDPRDGQAHLVIVSSSLGWPMLMSLAGFMALFQVLPLFYIPESPRYLLMQKGDEETARKGTMGPGTIVPAHRQHTQMSGHGQSP